MRCDKKKRIDIIINLCVCVLDLSDDEALEIENNRLDLMYEAYKKQKNIRSRKEEKARLKVGLGSDDEFEDREKDDNNMDSDLSEDMMDDMDAIIINEQQNSSNNINNKNNNDRHGREIDENEETHPSMYPSEDEISSSDNENDNENEERDEEDEMREEDQGGNDAMDIDQQKNKRGNLIVDVEDYVIKEDSKVDKAKR